MKSTARLVLATILVATSLLVLPRIGFGASSAFAGIGDPIPTPLLSDLIGDPEPEPSDDPDDDDDDDDGGSGSGSGSGDGGGKADNRDPKDTKDGVKGRNGRKGDDDGRGRKKKRGRVNLIPPAGTPDIPGSFSTTELMTVAAHLRSLGWTAEAVIERVYPPFIIAGEATWIDSWGVPRYGPGPIVRTHEGQDVFCDYGDPVLAPEDGHVSFSDGGLGGITARVHTPDGAYWYLTHLSDLNTEELSAGDPVSTGTIVGYCGNSGNAATTPPHVHFGWYQPNGEAKNPMRHLVGWLRDAEDSAIQLLVSVRVERQKQVPALTAARRFGDAFAPDRSILAGAEGESLWASGTAPATGAFALAEAALQAALSGGVYEPESISIPSAQEGAGGGGALDPQSSLAKLLERSHSHSHSHEAGD